jgi:RNA polymerase sigma-70 factor (ECF subfamily)
MNGRRPRRIIGWNRVDADDLTLVEEARKGSHAAFRTLVERYQRRVYAMALSIVRDPDEARDVVQDAFIKAYRGLDGFQGEAAFYTWLYRIALNLCIDRARRQKRSPRVEFDEAVTPEEEGDSGISPARIGFDPAQALVDGEIRLRVSAALERLSPTHRTVLVLREIEGLSYKEIADAMGSSIGTVMSRLFHARKRMQEMLRPLVEGEVPVEPAAMAQAQTGTGTRKASP